MAYKKYQDFGAATMIWLCLAILVAIVLWTTAWRPGGHVLSAPPVGREHPSIFAMDALIGAAGGLGACALLRRTAGMRTILVGMAVGAIVPPLALVFGDDRSGSGAFGAAVTAEEVLGMGVAGVLAAVLACLAALPRSVASTIFGGERARSARAPIRILALLALCATLGAQLIFHFTVLSPAIAAAHARVSAIMRHLDALPAQDVVGSLNAFASSGLAPFERLEDLDAASLSRRFGAITYDPDGMEASVLDIVAERPKVIFMWLMPGMLEADRHLLVYDGRGVEPIVALLPARAGDVTRTAAAAAYLVQSAIAIATWLSLAVLVALIHGRCRRKDGLAPSGSAAGMDPDCAAV